MKQIITIFILLFTISINAQEVTEPNVTSTTVYNDSKDAVKTVYSDVKSLSPEVKATLDRLAKTFNTSVDKLWDILVKQQLVYSICFLILTLSALFNWWLFYSKNFKKVKDGEYIKGSKKVISKRDNPKYTTYNNEPRQIDANTIEEEIIIPIPVGTIKHFKYLHLIICLTLSIFSFIHFSDMLTGFLNPEYGALKDIVYVALKVK